MASSVAVLASAGQGRPQSRLKCDPVWRAFREERSSEARDRLVERYMPLVAGLAREIRRRTVDAIELDDLISAGSVGLLQALEGFDLDRGLAFSTYANPRIRGAMIDQLRQQDWAPRSLRRRDRKVAAATAKLAQRLHRAPRRAEVAGELGSDLNAHQEWCQSVARSAPISFETRGAVSGREGCALQELLEDTEQVRADEQLERQEERARIRAAIDALPASQRTVLSLYYFEELNSGAIASVLEVSESRVSQIRSRAIAQLRVSLPQPEGQV